MSVKFISTAEFQSHDTESPISAAQHDFTCIDRLTMFLCALIYRWVINDKLSTHQDTVIHAYICNISLNYISPHSSQLCSPFLSLISFIFDKVLLIQYILHFLISPLKLWSDTWIRAGMNSEMHKHFSSYPATFFPDSQPYIPQVWLSHLNDFRTGFERAHFWIRTDRRWM